MNEAATPKYLDDMIKAEDVFPVWEQRIRAAENSITIFSPFLDTLLVGLLRDNVRIPLSQVVVVTDFTTPHILEHLRQIETVKTLMDMGVAVLSLSSLHAKLLIIDDKDLVLSSQNFTEQGRRNREASFVLSAPLQETRFLENVSTWKDEAEFVDQGLVELLLEEASSNGKAIGQLKSEAGSHLEEVLKQYKEAKAAEHRRRLAEQEEKSPVRLAAGAAFACIKKVKSSTGLFNYDSLLADYDCDLTHWETVAPNGHSYERTLERLTMYPLFMVDSLRLGFARVGKTRITYIWTGVDFHEEFEVGEQSFQVETNFPSRTGNHNIEFLLSVDFLKPICKVHMLFSGYALKFVHSSFTRDCSPDNKRLLKSQLLGSTKALERLFCKCFKNFNGHWFSHSEDNVHDFFKNGTYRLSLIQFKRVPFLVAQKLPIDPQDELGLRLRYY